MSEASMPIQQLWRLRIVARLTVACLLDLVAISKGDADPIDALLVGAIIQANLAELVQRSDLQLAYLEADPVPGDDQRRPVSVNALATSLGLPFETVRRRVNVLVRDGDCKAVDGGVIVPAEVLSQPAYQVGAFQAYERLRGFYYELRDHGVLGRLPEPVVTLAAGAFPVRTVGRLVGAYVLRIIETMGIHGDLVDGFILLQTFRSNIEHVDVGRPGMVEDDERHPISVSAIAGRIGLAGETVRRRTASLVGRGVLVRAGRGLIVPSSILNDPRLAAALARNAANLQRLFASLSRLGVLAVWDSLQPPEAAEPQSASRSA